jgi:hypothetical protein
VVPEGAVEAPSGAYKCVALTLGTNMVRRELKLPEAPVPAADPRFTLSGS